MTCCGIHRSPTWGHMMGTQTETAILFSDIRDFTEFTARKGDRQALALAKTHQQLANKASHAHTGAVVKAYGDGVMVRFDSAGSAVKAAEVPDKIGHQSIVIPGFVAAISGELEEELSGWEIKVGPREAIGIPSYLKQMAND